MRQVFLDHQSATPVLPEVLTAMLPWFSAEFGAPASFHRRGLAARRALELARGQFAQFLNAPSPEDIIFTSGGTEAANLAVLGTAYAQEKRGRHIVASATEHLSVLRTIAFLEGRGWTCTRVGVDRRGWVDPAAVRAALTADTVLICVHHANHELGAVQPISEIGQLAQDRGLTFFVDATATGGWLPIDVQAMGASLLSLSPHRLYGPKGVGVLYRHRQARLVAVQHGGSQEGGRRAGTENVPAIVGAGQAAQLALGELPERGRLTAALQARLWAGIGAQIPHVQLLGPDLGPARLSTNVNLAIEFVEGEGLVLRLDLQGVAAATGPACLSRALKVSHVLQAIGLDHGLAQGNLVFSLGRDNTEADIDYTIAVLTETVGRLRSLSPLWEEFQRGTLVSAITSRAGE